MSSKLHFDTQGREPLRVKASAFSWSRSRRRLFELCRRAYFYNYYGAIGGWDQYACDASEHIYRLKQLRTAEEWALDIFTQAVRHVFMHPRPRAYPNKKPLEQSLSHQLRRFYQRGYADVISETWKTDPKTTNLFEVYYGTAPAKEENVLTYVKQRLAQHLAGFTASGLFAHLAGVDHLKFKPLQAPQNFTIGELEIWTAPALAWRDEDRVKVLALRPGEAGTTEYLDFDSNILMMMVEQVVRREPEEVDVVYYFTGAPNQKPEMVLSNAVFDRDGTTDKIRRSADQMLECIYPDGTVNETDFPLWTVAADQICAGCRFKGFCKPGL